MTEGLSIRVADCSTDQQLAHALDRIDVLGAAQITNFSAQKEWWHALGLRLGSVVVPQYQGESVRHIRPDPAMESYAVSANNTKELAPHTENFEFPGLPPRFIALLCRRAALSGGDTLIYDSRDLLEYLGDDVVDELIAARYEWRSPASLASEGVQLGAQHAAIEPTRQGYVVRFSAREMYPLPDATAASLRLLETFRGAGLVRFAEHRIPVSLSRGDLLIWDNWRMIHSRTAFVGERHLERVMFL